MRLSTVNTMVYYTIAAVQILGQLKKKARAGTPTTDYLPCRTLSCEQVFLYLNVNSLHMFLLSPVYAPLQARAPRRAVADK